MCRGFLLTRHLLDCPEIAAASPTAVSWASAGGLLALAVAVTVAAAGWHLHTGLDLARSGHRRSETSHEERRDREGEEEEEGTMGTIQTLKVC